MSEQPNSTKNRIAEIKKRHHDYGTRFLTNIEVLEKRKHADGDIPWLIEQLEKLMAERERIRAIIDRIKVDQQMQILREYSKRLVDAIKD